MSFSRDMPGIIQSNIPMDQSFFEQAFLDFLIKQNVSRITRNNYISDLRHFFRWLSPLPPTTLSTDILEQYKQSQIYQYIPIASINRRLSTLRKFFACAAKNGWTTTNPTTTLSNITKTKATTVIPPQPKKTTWFLPPLAICSMVLLALLGSATLLFQIMNIRNEPPQKRIAALPTPTPIIKKQDVLGETDTATPSALPLPPLEIPSPTPTATPAATLTANPFLTMMQQQITGLFLATKTIVADSITVGGQSLNDYIHADITNAHLVSPLAQITELDTNTISPLSPDSSGIAVKLGPRQTFGIYTNEGIPETTFDSAGNATLSGSLTVDGTLYADRIVTKIGDFDTVRTASIAANFITNITNIFNATPAGQSPLGGAIPLPPPILPEATTSAFLSDVLITSSLGVAGSATLSDTAIRGTLATNIISPIGDGNITVHLKNSFGQLIVSNEQNMPVVAFDAGGNATMSGTLTASKLFIAGDSPLNATIGVATISATQTQVTVPAPSITDHSFIYLTPVTNPNDHILYIFSKDPGVSFTVGLSTPSLFDIEFNWWIIN